MLGEGIRYEMSDIDVRANRYGLPVGFQWSICDLRDEGTCYEIFNLVRDRAICPDDQFIACRDYLRWSLCPPGYFVDWHVGLRKVPSGELVGIVFAAPTILRVQNVVLPTAALHHLYVDSTVENVIPPLILYCEILRRVHLKGIWQQVSRWKLFIPATVSVSRVWERRLDQGQNRGLQGNMPELELNIHDVRSLFTLPDFLRRPGIREMRHSDVPAVTALLRDYLTQFAIAPVFTEEDVNHWLLPKVNVLQSFVNEMSADNPEITCFFSYTVQLLLCEGTAPIMVARLTYYATRMTRLPHGLIRDMLLTARYHLCDLFVIDNFMHNATFLEEVQFELLGGISEYQINNSGHMIVVPSSQIGLSLP